MIKIKFSHTAARPQARRASLVRKRETGIWQQA
jgi:hypothetical protein